jgi:hypothetical protein
MEKFGFPSTHTRGTFRSNPTLSLGFQIDVFRDPDLFLTVSRNNPLFFSHAGYRLFPTGSQRAGRKRGDMECSGCVPDRLSCPLSSLCSPLPKGHCYLMQDDLQKAYAAYQQALYLLPNPKVKLQKKRTCFLKSLPSSLRRIPSFGTASASSTIGTALSTTPKKPSRLCSGWTRATTTSTLTRRTRSSSVSASSTSSKANTKIPSRALIAFYETRPVRLPMPIFGSRSAMCMNNRRMWVLILSLSLSRWD